MRRSFPLRSAGGLRGRSASPLPLPSSFPRGACLTSFTPTILPPWWVCSTPSKEAPLLPSVLLSCTNYVCMNCDEELKNVVSKTKKE